MSDVRSLKQCTIREYELRICLDNVLKCPVQASTCTKWFFKTLYATWMYLIIRKSTTFYKKSKCKDKIQPHLQQKTSATTHVRTDRESERKRLMQYSALPVSAGGVSGMGRARVEGFWDPPCLWCVCVCVCVSVCVFFCQMECFQLAATIYEGTATHVTGELTANVILPSHNESVGSVTEQECALGCVHLCDTGHRVSSVFLLWPHRTMQQFYFYFLYKLIHYEIRFSRFRINF